LVFDTKYRIIPWSLAPFFVTFFGEAKKVRQVDFLKQETKYLNIVKSPLMKSPYLLITLIAILFLHLKCSTNEYPIDNTLDTEEVKQKGAHVFGIEDKENLDFLKDNHIEWVTLVSWGYMDNFDSPEVNHHFGDSSYIKKRNGEWLTKIKYIRSQGFKILFKPHIWISNPDKSKWRSDVYPNNDIDWEEWKINYEDFIMRYALLAEETGVEMLCIGTELSSLTSSKEAYWKELIQKLRKVYSGKLTYAANWYEEYQNIGFWNELDYIGIQAYFPLTENYSPSTAQIENGWIKYLQEMKKTSKENEKQIIFTELGYKSTTDSATKPWEWIEKEYDEEKVLSLQTQSNCYKAFFNQVWNKEWFGGVHLWQYNTHHNESLKMEKNKDFTPQGKSAEQIITENFRKK